MSRPLKRKRHAIYAKPKELRDQVVFDYAWLVRLIARQLTRKMGQKICLDDMISEGFVGLIQAFNHYDPMRATSFKSFAEARIRGAMYDYVRLQDRLSRSQRSLSKKLARVTAQLMRRLGRQPELAELAEELKLSSEKLLQLRSLADTNSFEYDPEDADIQRGHQLSGWAVNSKSPSEILFQKYDKLLIKEQIKSLLPQERRVLRLYYYNSLTMQSIAAKLGITESRVCQIHKRALVKLAELLTPEMRRELDEVAA